MLEVTKLTLNREKSHPRQEDVEGEEQDDHLTDKVMKQTNDETRSKGRPSILLLTSNRNGKSIEKQQKPITSKNDNGSEVLLQIF